MTAKTPSGRIVALVAFALVAVGSMFAAPSRVVGAVATITVDRLDDTAAASACTGAVNDCSLRGAVIFANAHPGTSVAVGTEIIVPAGTYQLTIPGSAGSETNGLCGNPNVGDLDVSGNNTVITGAGAATTIIQQTTSDRVICTNPSVVDNFVFTMSGLHITGGRETTGVGGAGYVGGAYQNSTFISNCIFSNNQMTASASLGGGAIGLQGGDLTISNCTFGGVNPPGASQTDTSQANLSGTSGGAISYMSGDIKCSPCRTTTGTMTLTNSTFLNNVANSGSAGGGALDTFAFNNPGGTAIVNVTGSTFTGNRAPSASGGAIVNESAILTVDHSTFTGNTAGFNGGAVYSSGTATLTKNVFTSNQVSQASGHGGAVGQAASAGPMVVSFSRFIGNTAATPANGNTVSKASGGAGSTFDASNNWWSRSSGPNATDVSGTVTTTPFLQLKTTASPATIVTNQTTALTASFNTNSANTDVSANIDVLLGLPVSWSSVGGTLSGAQASIQTSGGGKGTATATYTATAAAVGNSATAQVDNGPASGSANTALITVNKANTTASITNAAALSGTDSVTGQAVAVSYSVTGAFGNGPTAPTGMVTVSDGTDSCTGAVAAGTCNVTFRTAGAKSVTATYNGDANFNVSPASSAASHTVNKADTTTTITSDNPDPSVTGQPVTIGVSVAAVAPGAAVAPTTITGTVTVSDGGSNTCMATLVAGTGSCTIAFPAVGSFSLTASYGGDANFNGSATATSTSHTVNKADTTTTITSDSPDPSSHGAPVAVDYSVVATSPGAGVPTGNVTVSDGVDSCNASVAIGTCTITLTTPGNRTLVATYDGDGNYNGSTSSAASHTVTVPDLTVGKSHGGNFSQGQGNAQYTITVTNVGTEATSGTVSVTDVPPAGLTPTALSGAGWACTLGTLTCTRSDPLSAGASYPGITLTVDVAADAGTPITNAVTVSGGGELDVSNNSASDETTVVPDLVAPETTLDTHPTDPSTSPSASFTFSGTDAGSGVDRFECDLDGSGFSTCTSPANHPSLNDGSHLFRVRAIDRTGNVDASPASFTWTIDTTGPTVTINQAAGQADPTSGLTIHFTAVFSEPVSGFGDSAGDVTLSGSAGATTAVVTQIAPNDGTTYDVAVTGMTVGGSVSAALPAAAAQDAATNPSAASTSTDATVTWTIDTTGPNTTIDGSPSNPSSSASATFAFSGSDDTTPAQSLTFECSLDGAGFSACTSPQSYNSLAPGGHTFQVRAIDAASNADPTPASYTWTIQSLQAPTTLAYNGDGVVVIGGTLVPAALLSSATASCIAGQTVAFSLDRNPMTGAAGSFALGSATTDAGGQATLSPVSAGGWLGGVYDLTATFAGAADCLGSADTATLSVASPGDAAYGGGRYSLNGSDRINFAFTVRKLIRVCQTNCIYLGLLVLQDTGHWRLAGGLSSYSKTADGHGVASGAGILQWWNPNLRAGRGGWQLAKAVTPFTIRFFDGGPGGPQTSNDAFGIQINFSPTPPQPALPNSSPQPLDRGIVSVN
jgi:predicted outer membrane repeat protein